MRIVFAILWFFWLTFFLYTKGLAHGALALPLEAASMTLTMPGICCAAFCSAVLRFEMAPWTIQGLSLLFWMIPTNRIKRWFGTFDPFPEPKLIMPSITRGLAATLDWLRRLKTGNGKMGGWA